MQQAVTPTVTRAVKRLVNKLCPVLRKQVSRMSCMKLLPVLEGETDNVPDDNEDNRDARGYISGDDNEGASGSEQDFATDSDKRVF